MHALAGFGATERRTGWSVNNITVLANLIIHTPITRQRKHPFALILNNNKLAPHREDGFVLDTAEPAGQQARAVDDHIGVGLHWPREVKRIKNVGHVLPAERNAQGQARRLEKVEVDDGVERDGAVEGAPVGEGGYFFAAEEPELALLGRGPFVLVCRRRRCGFGE